MIPDKHKAVSSILSKMGVGAPEPKAAPDEGLRAAAEELIAALHSKDVSGVIEALRSFSDLQGEPDGEEGTESGDEMDAGGER